MRILWLAVMCLWAGGLWAEPQSYALDRTQSTVAFTFTAIGTPTRARAPVSTADVALDFQDVTRSQIDVYVDATRVRTTLPFIAMTLKSADILHVAAHPEINFRSTDIRLNVPGDYSKGARVAGMMTIRGISQPAVLQATLLRQAGTAPGDLSELVVEVTGTLDRRAFGIIAYGDLVAPDIALNITARLAQR